LVFAVVVVDMVDGRGRRWRWSNVPVPEPHVAGLVAGLACHLVWPWRVREGGRSDRVTGRSVRATERSVRATGGTLVGIGLLVVGWAVRTVGGGSVERPNALVTSGPYAFSRNPMYVAWTMLYVGVALVANTRWPFLALPAVVAATHRIVRREERSLERAFGDEYRAYRRDVRRYV